MRSDKPGSNSTLVIPAEPPVEHYSARRRAEFLLNNAVDATDYKRAVREVRRLGLNPEDIPHRQL